MHATPTAPQQQPFRKLNYSRIAGWEVAWIGNDEKVNHCALTRGTTSADLKPGEPKFVIIVDNAWMIARVRDASYKFTEKKALAVTAITAEGVESTPLAATGGPDLADIRFSAERRRGLVDLLQEGVDSGELPATASPDLLADALVGPIVMRRLFMGAACDPNLAATIVDQVLPAAPAKSRKR